MSDILDEAQALIRCKTCPWYKSCVLPVRVTEDDIRKQMESAISGSSTQGIPPSMWQFFSAMTTAVQNSILEGCPIFIERLRSTPKLAERIKKMMQEWSTESSK